MDLCEYVIYIHALSSPLHMIKYNWGYSTLLFPVLGFGKCGRRENVV